MNFDIDYNDVLYEKALAEFSALLEELQRSTPEEVIDRAYEKVIKQDFLSVCEYRELEQDKARALSRTDCPLSEMYGRWLKNDMSYMEMLETTAEDTAKELLDAEKSRSRNRDLFR